MPHTGSLLVFAITHLVDSPIIGLRYTDSFYDLCLPSNFCITEGEACHGGRSGSFDSCLLTGATCMLNRFPEGERL